MSATTQGLLLSLLTQKNACVCSYGSAVRTREDNLIEIGMNYFLWSSKAK